MINKRIQQLRNIMEEKKIFAYIIPSADYHQSEYVGEYFKSRTFISGFTGSAGTVVVTKNEAGLWTDGRYFIQAAKEIENSCMKLFKMGEEGVPTVEEYLINNIPENSNIGFDGRVFSAKEGEELAGKLKYKNIEIKYEEDLIDKIWKDRPNLENEKAFLLDTKYTGESVSSKIERVRKYMRQVGATTHIVATLDDIAWIFNIRGNDIKYNPVVLSYAIIMLDEVYLFIEDNKLDLDIRNELSKKGIKIKSYNDIYQFIKNIKSDEVVLLDISNVSYSIYNSIPKGIKKIEKRNPTILFKSIKNKVELENIKNSHIKDGVAFTKFMYWIKNNVDKFEITEVSAEKKLEEFRSKQEGFIEPSFSTIAAYKDHAAMMHYSATKETDYKLEQEGLFLIDSGGQYYDGTTDITRTLVLGKISGEMKLHFTTVARSMIRLSMAKFLHGTRGYNLDILARGPLWDLGIDYKCGTGHGIGFVLNVHESPNGFRWKIRDDIDDSCILEEGMVTTNEPGVYIEGSHGIRTENEIVVKQLEKNEYGQFLNFEVVTYAPIDLDGINPDIMDKKEKEYLNNYHKKVYEIIKPYLNDEEKIWLKEYTRPI
ncbi:aminopeptidase P family protein [Romboutsia maritimum]|uniref:Aminopeptidase P family protein n=1 Tax=Romboutsia maritimum TaxID=2020948 RepID=A0A371IT33_9FIRM|nr:aminopeptidase P family protein [Romboutsia maritimum]RDY23647.1 aminopeptidase P family protein [Romboutsia maritimum]